MPKWLPLALFAVVGALLITLVHRWLWVRLVRDTGLPQPLQAVGTSLVILLAVGTVAGMGAGRFLGGEASRLVAQAGFVWMGTMFLLVVALSGGEVLRLLASLWERMAGQAGDEAIDPERRLLLARAVGGSASLGATLAGGVALHRARRAPDVVEIAVPLQGLPAALDGFRLVQISDLHVSSLIRREFVAEVVRLANAAQPDAIALTGDLVDGSVDMLREDIAPLSQLRARHGVFFVTGNHEYYSGADAWIAHLASLGARPLRNERTQINHNGEALDLIGVDDWTAARFGGDHGPDLARAVAGRDQGVPSVLLAHQPRQVDEAAAHGIDVMLSGHTHGGQLWPFGALVRLVQPYVAGLHRHRDRTWIYVSRGTGWWGPPMRLAAPHEVTVVVLRRAAEQAAA